MTEDEKRRAGVLFFPGDPELKEIKRHQAPLQTLQKNASVEVPEKEKNLVEEPKVVSSKVSVKQKTSKARAKKKPGVR